MPWFSFFAGLFIGCTSTPVDTHLENIQCQYNFRGVDQRSERERIYSLVRQYAKPGTLVPADVPGTADFQLSFVVARVSAIDQMHGPILFARPSDAGAAGQQAFNAHNPTFSINYDTVTLGAKIEVIVNFTVTPGAQLFLRAEGDAEKDITPLVGANGAVLFKTSIHKGQDYIYARTVSENVVRYIRINVYTQQVDVIPRSAYP